jgi:hypothetical protein
MWVRVLYKSIKIIVKILYYYKDIGLINMIYLSKDIGLIISMVYHSKSIQRILINKY